MSSESSFFATPTLADFPALVALPELSDLALSASEAHGIYCGLLCAGERAARTRWLAELLPAGAVADPQSLDCRAALNALAQHTEAAFADQGLPRFALLLPADEAPLATRVLAVHDWCRGFLFGLGLGGCDPMQLTGEAREALADLSELTRIDLDDLAEDEEHEQALTEITEFLRVAAMLVHQDRLAAQVRA